VARVLESVQFTDYKVSTDKFCTDIESDKGGLVIRTYWIDNKTYGKKTHRERFMDLDNLN